MGRIQMQNIPPRNNSNNRGNNNNQWPRRNPPNDQRPPTPLESANMIDEHVHFCRTCESFHEESPCAFVGKNTEKGGESLFTNQ